MIGNIEKMMKQRKHAEASPREPNPTVLCTNPKIDNCMWHQLINLPPLIQTIARLVARTR